MTPQEGDKLVAEKVMGWDVNFMAARDPGSEQRLHWKDCENSTLYLPEQWCPSESREAAMDVVEKILSDWKNEVEIHATACAPNDGVLWSVRFKNMEGQDEKEDDYSFEHAVVRAALKFVGVKIK